MNKSIGVTQELERRQKIPLITLLTLDLRQPEISRRDERCPGGRVRSLPEDQEPPPAMSGPHFRDYPLLLDDQGDQLFEMTDPIAESIRKLGGDHAQVHRPHRRLHHLSGNDASARAGGCALR
jgi:hypothetical protein